MKKWFIYMAAGGVLLLTLLVLLPAVVLRSQAAVPRFEDVLVYGSGSDEGKVVITIVGDGYTAAEQNSFVKTATTIAGDIVNRYPYSLFKDRMNIHAIKVVSEVSGLNPGTYFQSSFGTYIVPSATGYQRIRELVADYTPTAVAKIMVANTNSYVACAINSEDLVCLGAPATMFATHELGHALGHLEDEYTNANILRENANSTQNSQPATARWKNFIGINGIGLALRNSRWYYPSVNEGSCIMANGRNFCLVCSAAMVERLADSAAMPFYGTLFNGVAVTTDQKQLNTATAITVPDGTDWIVDFAFHGCDRLQTLTIPASVKTIGEYAFLRCTGLTDITNQAVSPQNITAGADRFYGVTRSNITLNVPAGTTSAYLAAGWTGFREIREGGRTNNAQAPAITAQPTDVTVDVGASVQLTVTATVTRGELGYQWFESAIRVNHSGSPIASATNASYQPSTSEVGAKYYYCIITNTDSQATGTKTAAVTSDVAAVTVNQKGGDDTGDPGDDTGDPGDDTDDPGDDTGDSGDDTGDSGDDTGDPGDDTWEDGQIYVGGEIVLYQGQKWRAKWWTLSAPGTDDSWELMSDSNEYIPGRAYVGGETVVYQGQTWRAKWWTTAVPGSDNTWELVT